MLSVECIAFGGITSENCDSKLSYSKTFFPNPVFATKDDAKIIGENLSVLSVCDPRASAFFCGLVMPQCPSTTSSGYGQGPCRSLCKELASIKHCKQLFQIARTGTKLSDYCDLLPPYPVPGNPDFCTFDISSTAEPPTTEPRK